MSISKLTIPRPDIDPDIKISESDDLCSASTLVEFEIPRPKLSKVCSESIVTETKTPLYQKLAASYAKSHQKSVALTEEWRVLLNERRNAITYAKLQLSDSKHCAQEYAEYQSKAQEIIGLAPSQRPHSAFMNYGVIEKEIENSQLDIQRISRLESEIDFESRVPILDRFEIELPAVTCKITTLKGMQERVERCTVNMDNSIAMIDFLKRDIEGWRAKKEQLIKIEKSINRYISLFGAIIEEHKYNSQYKVEAKTEEMDCNLVMQTLNLPLNESVGGIHENGSFNSKRVTILGIAPDYIGKGLPALKLLLFILIVAEFLVYSMNRFN